MVIRSDGRTNWSKWNTWTRWDAQGQEPAGKSRKLSDLSMRRRGPNVISRLRGSSIKCCKLDNYVRDIIDLDRQSNVIRKCIA